MKVIISGEYACFTRSEMKVERVSYDVPTVSALEGVLKAIYWKPSIRYKIKRIVVFNPIKFMNVRINEVSEKVAVSKIKSKIDNKDLDICVYPGECRSQRSSLVLKDVRYGVEFDIELTGLCSERDSEEAGNDTAKILGKHYDILQRRLLKGQCYKTPCLGLASYRADVELVEDFDLSRVDASLKGDIDLGFMLYRICFNDKGHPKGKWHKENFSDKAYGTYYRPRMIDGVIDVCRYDKEVRGC